MFIPKLVIIAIILAVDPASAGYTDARWGAALVPGNSGGIGEAARPAGLLPGR